MDDAAPEGGEQPTDPATPPKKKYPSELARAGVVRPRKAGEGKHRRYRSKPTDKPKAAIRDRNNLAYEQRLEKIAQLRIEGYTIPAIAKKLSVSVGQTHKDIQDALERTIDRTNNAIAIERQVSLARIEVGIRGIWPKYAKGDTDAINAFVKLDSRRAKLLGLDVPIKAELTGPDGGAIPVSAPTSQLESKLDDLFKRLAGGVPATAAAVAPAAVADGAAAEEQPG